MTAFERLRPWQAVRYFCTDETSFAPQPPLRTFDLLTPDISGFDAALGRSYAELGLEARSMHKCQGTSQLLLLPGQSQNDILRTALSTGRSRKGSLVACIRARIEPLGGVELEIAPREAIREPVNLDK